MVLITTESVGGVRTTHKVPGSLADVGEAIGSALDGAVYFSFPGRIGFILTVAEIVAIEYVAPTRPATPTRASFLQQAQR